MITEIFTFLTHAIENNSGLIIFGAAFLWGIVSVLLSPCHLAGVPLIVAYIGGQGKMSYRRAACIAILFALGMLITIGVIGLVTASAGRLIGDIGGWGNIVLAGLFIIFGLAIMEVIKLPGSKINAGSMRKKSLFGGFLLGLIFGIAVGPCTFAFMGPVLAVSLKLGSESFISGAIVLVSYGLGHCGIIAAMGSSVEIVQKYVDWGGKSKTRILMRYACGALLIISGLYLLYSAV